jgi:phage terminase large subunit-like protein
MPEPQNLSPEAKDNLARYWSRYQHQIQQQYGYDLIKEGLALRYRCQTDGFWLAREVLGYRAFGECHKELFSSPEEPNNFFVLKNPSAKSFKDFAESDKGLHDRLLFLPRGGFKSTADIVDVIQWLLCFTSIRINIMTGTVSLAEEFTGIIKGHFTLDAIEDKDKKKEWDGPYEMGEPKVFDADHEFAGKLRLIQILFPEHCEAKPGEQPEWITPARKSKDIAGPSVRATSLGKNTTGTHCDLLKLDDPTTAENTQNKDRIASVNREIAMARKLCEPYGYKDRIGTPYHQNDNLTSTVKDEETRFRNGHPAMVKVLMHPAGVVKPGYEDLTIDLLQDHMIDLWFPERLTLAVLKTEYVEANKTGDTATFYSQFFLDLNKSFETKFRRELMVARTVDTCPQSGMTFEAWDLAYSEQKGAKYTVGIAGLFTMQGIYIVDMVRGRFSEYELPAVMANFAHKWKPRRVAVEDSMGARWLNAEIRREQERLRIHVPFEFVNLGKGSKANSKEVKAKPAVRLLGDGRLYFWKAMTGLEELYNELEAFPKGTYTDIVCSLSLLVNHFNAFADTSPLPQTTVTDSMEKLRRDLVYGLGAFAPRVQDATAMAYSSGPQEYDRDPVAEAGLMG